jgi:hypothetical protein
MTRRKRQEGRGAEWSALGAVGWCCARRENGRVWTRRTRVNGGAVVAFPQGRDLREVRNTRILLSGTRSKRKGTP